MNDIKENPQDQEYPDLKPNSGKLNNLKIAFVAIGIVAASVFLWAAFAGVGGKTKKVTQQTDTISTPEYEEAMKKNNLPVSEFQEGGNSLLPKTQNGQERFDPNSQGPYSTDRPKIGDEVGYPQNASYDQNSSQSQSNRYSDNHKGNEEYSGSSEAPTIVSKEIQNRLDAGYQAEIEHFKGTQKFAWSIDGATYEKLKTGDKISSVEEPLKDLYDGASNQKVNKSFIIPAGTRIIATTDQAISTDHPGYFTSTVARPFELKKSKLICQAGQNENDRVPVQPIKIILPDNTELSVQGLVEMGSFPGLEGKITDHWPQRILPAIASAAIGGGAAAYLLQTQTPGATETNAGNISTRDLIAGPILENSVQGVQNEITRYSKDLPNTVLVKAGEQFSILLTEKLTINR